MAPTRGFDIATANVAGFCASPDAPAWIVAPLADGAATPAGTEWTAPIRQLAVTEGRDREVWRVLSRYAVIPCAKSR